MREVALAVPSTWRDSSVHVCVFVSASVCILHQHSPAVVHTFTQNTA
jgi:hypothetical protein